MDPEADYEPFEVVEKDGRTVLRLHGTEEQRVKVEADRVHIIMAAIVQGCDIDIEYADIDGGLNILAIIHMVKSDDNGKPTTKGDMRFFSCSFSGIVSFIGFGFSGNADFRSSIFSRDASFGHWSAPFKTDSELSYTYCLLRRIRSHENTKTIQQRIQAPGH